MFEDDTFKKVAEGSDYMREDIANLLECAQLERMSTEVVEEIKRKKNMFIRTEGNDVTEMRDKIQRMFTTILIRRVKYELAESKKAIEHKMETMAANNEKRNESWNRIMEKETITRNRVARAQQAMPQLLDITSYHLGQETLSDDETPGNRK